MAAKMRDIRIRPVKDADIAVFFANEHEPGAAEMAGFAARPKVVFFERWRLIRADPENCLRAVLVDGEVAGQLLLFTRDGKREVGYWLAQRFWHQGIATAAVRLFLAGVMERPLTGKIAPWNLASARVLEKCGFRRVAEDADDVIFELE